MLIRIIVAFLSVLESGLSPESTKCGYTEKRKETFETSRLTFLRGAWDDVRIALSLAYV